MRCGITSRQRHHDAALHMNLLPQKNQSQLRSQSRSTVAEFLDGVAQCIILTIIFQAIDAKFCNRASFRQDVQDSCRIALLSRSAHPQRISLFAVASVWHASCKAVKGVSQPEHL
jgi:hypothetical protein